MSVLLHPVEEIIQQVLIDIGIGTNPEDGAAWPIFAPTEPDSPDDCLTVQQYAGIETGSNALSGQVYTHEAVQVRIRCSDNTLAARKAWAVFESLNETINAYAVALEESIYCVDSVTTVGTMVHLGKMRPEMRLELYTVNCLVDVRRLV